MKVRVLEYPKKINGIVKEVTIRSHKKLYGRWVYNPKFDRERTKVRELIEKGVFKLPALEVKEYSIEVKRDR